jgi:methionyl-tRNA formyltransferase
VRNISYVNNKHQDNCVKIIFAGTPHFAAGALAALLKEHQIAGVLTQPDRPSGRGMQLTASPVKLLALQQGLTVLQPDSLKNENVQNQLAALQADVMVVAAYGLILPKAVLAIPRLGCLNIHASLLPRWRGAAPIQRAILAGDSETGITIMQMDAGLDTGDMLLRRACPIDAADNAQSLHDKLAQLGAECILETLTRLEQIEPVVQDNQLACYAAKLLKSEALIDWHQDAVQIERAIRAFNPYPVSQASINNTVIRIWQASCGKDLTGVPGEILSADKSGIVVACGSGSINLQILQKPGGKVLTAAQFLQAMPIPPGNLFQVI